MIYMTLVAATGAIDRFYPTQAEANARAATSATLSAHQGSVDPPDDILPGRGYYRNNGFEHDPELSTIEEIKQAAYVAHEHINQLHDKLTFESKGHSWNEQGICHDWIHKIHQGCYAVGMDGHISGQGVGKSFTNANKKNFFVAIPNGPLPDASDTDARDILSIFSAIAALVNTSTEVSVFVYPQFYVNPANGLQLSLGIAVGESRNVADFEELFPATDQQLADGGWIEGIV